MDSRTLELFRCLQSGPHDAAALQHIQRLLGSQRRVLRGASDLATLAELVQLLEGWASAAGDGALSASALGEAAEIAERELRQLALANDLRSRAAAAGQGLASEIERLELALDEDASPAHVQQLAELYVQRAAAGDREQAAELYCTLGEVLGNPEGIMYLEQALAQVPEHAEARSLLAQYRGFVRTLPVLAVPGVARESQPQLTAAAGRLPSLTATLQMAAPLGPAQLTQLDPPWHPSPPEAERSSQPVSGEWRPVAQQPVLDWSAAARQPPSAAASERSERSDWRPAARELAALELPELQRAALLHPVSSLSPVVYEGSSELATAARKRGRTARWVAFAAVGLSAAAAFGLFVRVPAPGHSSEMLARVQSVSAAHEPAAESELAAPSAEPAHSEPAPAEPTPAPEPAEKSTIPPEPAVVASPAVAAGPTVKAMLEQLSIRGGHLTGTSLGAALDKTTYPRLTECYEHALAQRPRVKGRLIVGFTVKANGHAANAKNIGGSLKDAALIRCSLDAVEATRFPKPRKQAAKITLPFQYRPS